MLHEFCSLTGAEESKFVKAWEKYAKLVFMYGPLEKKKAIKNLLIEYQAGESENAGKFKYCIDVCNSTCNWLQTEQQHMHWIYFLLYFPPIAQVGSHFFHFSRLQYSICFVYRLL